MKWLLIILVIISPAILYVFALLAVAVGRKFYRRPCPACQQRGLQCVAWDRVLIDDGDGKHHCESWSYYQCDHCNAIFIQKNKLPLEPYSDEAGRFVKPPA